MDKDQPLRPGDRVRFQQHVEDVAGREATVTRLHDTFPSMVWLDTDIDGRPREDWHFKSYLDLLPI